MGLGLANSPSTYMNSRLASSHLVPVFLNCDCYILRSQRKRRGRPFLMAIEQGSPVVPNREDQKNRTLGGFKK